MQPDPNSAAAELLRMFEGYSSTPYWDDTAYRAGYGSDTYTDANGQVHRVTTGSTVSRDDAERDLARRIPEFQQQGVIPYVGQEAWNKLTPQAQAAVTSLVYNYGSLRGLPSLARAIKSGDENATANAIQNRGGDNSGVNRNRRAKEAAYITDAGVAAGGQPTGNTAVGTQLDVTPVLPSLMPKPGAPGTPGGKPLPAPAPLQPAATANVPMPRPRPATPTPVLPQSTAGDRFTQPVSAATTRAEQAAARPNTGSLDAGPGMSWALNMLTGKWERKPSEPAPARVLQPIENLGAPVTPILPNYEAPQLSGPAIGQAAEQTGKNLMGGFVSQPPGVAPLPGAKSSGSQKVNTVYVSPNGDKRSPDMAGSNSEPLPVRPKGTPILPPAMEEQGRAPSKAPTTRYTVKQMVVDNPDYLKYIEAQKADPIGTGVGSFADLQTNLAAITPKPAPPKKITVSRRVAITDGGGLTAPNTPILPAKPAKPAKPAINPSNHNAAALAAINAGKSTYTGSNGALMPTKAMNGNIRNTYGD